MKNNENPDPDFEAKLADALKEDAYRHVLRLDPASITSSKPPGASYGIWGNARAFVGVGIAAVTVVVAFVAVSAVREAGGRLSGVGVPMHSSESDLTPQAAFWGQLVLDDGCVELHWRGSERFLSWPSPATSVRRSTISLDGVEVAIGDYVIVTGGDYAARAPGDAAWVVPPPDQCWQERVVRVGDIEAVTRAELEELQEP